MLISFLFWAYLYTPFMIVAGLSRLSLNIKSRPIQTTQLLLHSSNTLAFPKLYSSERRVISVHINKKRDFFRTSLGGLEISLAKVVAGAVTVCVTAVRVAAVAAVRVAAVCKSKHSNTSISAITAITARSSSSSSSASCASCEYRCWYCNCKYSYCQDSQLSLLLKAPMFSCS